MERNFAKSQICKFVWANRSNRNVLLFEVDREFELDEVVPIGRPFHNTEILLLDENNKLVEDGNVGEICVRGTSLTLGYYNNFEKTNEVFVQNPLNSRYPELIYKTGDLGKEMREVS